MNWSTDTSQPKSPRLSVRRPKTGVTSGPSARRVAGPARPSTGSPARRWNALVASTVLRWAITGGAGFLGLHLARRLLAGGNEVRTLDLAPLDDAELERSVEEVRGDVGDPGDAAQLANGADVLVHAAAALPIQASRDSIRSVNVEGAAVVLAAALEAGVGRAVLISSTA